MPIRCVKGGALLVLATLVAVAAAAGEAISPNAWNLDNASPGTPLSTNPTNADLIRLFNSSTAEMYADLMLTSVTAQRTFAHAIPSIVDYSQTAHATTAAGRAESAGALASLYPSYCAPNKNWVMWDTPFLVKETKKREDGYLGYDQDIGGFATGISRMLGDTSAIGLAVGYDYRKMNGRDGYVWKERADAFHSALYGGTAIGGFFLDAYAGFSREWQRTSRIMDGGGIIGYHYNRGKYNNTVLSAGLRASYVWILPSGFRITPAIGLDYSHVRMGSFNEWDGGGTNPPASRSRLSIDKTNYNNLALPITVSVNRTFATDFLAFGGHQALWTPEVRGGWVPQFGPKKSSVNTIHNRASNDFGPPVAPFVSNSTPLAGSYGTVGAGLKIKLRGKYVFAVDYDYSWANKYQNHTLTGTYGQCF